MKTLILLRHAKSSWDDPSLRDFDRPLSPRGVRAGQAIGDFLSENGWTPDTVLCSAAKRTMETWQLVSDQLDAQPSVEFQHDLYHASPETILDVVKYQSDGSDRLLVVGHNPGIGETALYLIRDGSQKLTARLERKYPTGALAVITFPVDKWTDVKWRAGRLEEFVRPKDLS